MRNLELRNKRPLRDVAEGGAYGGKLFKLISCWIKLNVAVTRACDAVIYNSFDYFVLL